MGGVKQKIATYVTVFLGLLGVLFVGGTIGYKINNDDIVQDLVKLQTKEGCSKSCVETQKNNENAEWKIFHENDFTMLVPNDWKKGANRLLSDKNSSYYLNFTIHNVDEIKNETAKSLVSQGKLREYEELNVETMCKESDACGKLTQFREINVDNGVGLEFVISYPGLSIEEKRGSINEIHETIITNGQEYRFWTSERSSLQELLNKYPKLDPSPTLLFKEVMQTLKIGSPY